MPLRRSGARIGNPACVIDHYYGLASTGRSWLQLWLWLWLLSGYLHYSAVCVCGVRFPLRPPVTLGRFSQVSPASVCLVCLACLACSGLRTLLEASLIKPHVCRCLSRYSLTPKTRVHPSFLNSSCPFLSDLRVFSFLITRIPSPDSLPGLFFSYDPVSSSSQPSPIAHNSVLSRSWL
ncbi:hypothetical protein F5Y09DRAFT_295675 [Xylaria sp. FL1042]|nr:hypothetical protein F5Y09DRAFT_295675 [Xylaria sp. FL1042]